MRWCLRRDRLLGTALGFVVMSVVAAVLAGATAAGGNQNAYRVTTLVSDRTDPNLVNAWGLAAGPTSPWWVADNGTDVSTLYDAAGTVMSLVVSVGGGPTGTVFNGTTSFVVTDGTNSGASLFLFSSEDGKILGWSPAVPPPPPSTASQVAVDRSGQGAIYKGLAIASTPAGDFLYATDFHNGRGGCFRRQLRARRHAGRLRGRQDPLRLRALRHPEHRRHDLRHLRQAGRRRRRRRPGAGTRLCRQVRHERNLLGRVATRGQLNAPWGLAIAPAAFGKFGGDLLVGNFGNGEINAYKLGSNGKFHRRGTLRNPRGKQIKISGLWALAFGNGAPANGPTDTLFFTAGPRDEQGGRFGTISAK